VTAGCEPAVTTPSEPTTLAFTAGANQSGTVGTALPVKIVIRAANAAGGMANVPITIAPDAESGSVPSATVTTGAGGTAEFIWTLGTRAGLQTLRARAGTRTPVTASISATANPGPPAMIRQVSDSSQPVVVGHAAGIRPVVRVTDAHANPIASAAVNFQADQGASTLTGTSRLTDADGRATLGSWTIGLEVGTYTIRAFLLDGTSAVFAATGIPAAFAAVEGSGQTANVGTALPIAPAVRASRDDGSPLPGVPVEFGVLGGGGSVEGGAAVTDADGVARPARWILGPMAGNNRVQATTLGRAPVTFDATGVAGAATAMVLSGGSTLAGYFGNFLPGVPEVTATDTHGNPVALVPVTFQVTSGDGELTGAHTQTDYLGRARPTGWRLGSSGLQSVMATSTGFPPISFTAQAAAVPASSFRIEVRYQAPTNPTPAQREAFDAAIARWTSIIVAGGPPYQIHESAGCGNMIGETIDGVVINVVLRPIQGNVLGSAGPCIVRDQGYLPVQGYMELNTNFLPQLEQNGQLNAVILHEMAHVLGFGTMWNYNGLPGQPFNHLLDGNPGTDPTFNGLTARAAFYAAMGAGAYTGTAVPVEGLPYGPGTAYSHWRKTVFGTELMTGFVTAGSISPLSAVTVASLRDLGYQVNDLLSDSFSFQAFVQSYGQPALELPEEVLPGEIVVINRQGRRVGSIPRRPFR
jgi:hypothetical protein